ncbi:MAG: discoidin domain-containing protein, partial [Patescibacteria group bacterium]
MRKITKNLILSIFFGFSLFLIPISLSFKPAINISKGAEAFLVEIPIKNVAVDSKRSSDYLPEYAIDEDNNTAWCSSDTSHPHNIVLDLGSTYSVRGLH